MSPFMSAVYTVADVVSWIIQVSAPWSSRTTRKLTYGWMLKKWTNRSVCGFFPVNESKQNRRTTGSHICCENRSRNFKLSVVGRQSHKRTRRCLCVDSCVSKPILYTYPHQPDINIPTTEGLQSTNTVCHSRGDWRGEGLFHITQTPTEIEVNTFDLQKDACSDPDQLCDRAQGFP